MPCNIKEREGESLRPLVPTFQEAVRHVTANTALNWSGDDLVDDLRRRVKPRVARADWAHHARKSGGMGIIHLWVVMTVACRGLQRGFNRSERSRTGAERRRAAPKEIGTGGWVETGGFGSPHYPLSLPPVRMRTIMSRLRRRQRHRAQASPGKMNVAMRRAHIPLCAPRAKTTDRSGRTIRAWQCGIYVVSLTLAGGGRSPAAPSTRTPAARRGLEYSPPQMRRRCSRHPTARARYAARPRW
jgi:hypothetical protein